MRFATLSLAAALLAGAAPPVLAADSGGASAPGANPAPGAVGGASTPPRGGAPVARLSVVSPMTTGRPQIRVRFSGAGNEGVTARVVVLRSPGNAVAGRIVLGSVPVGRTIAVPWRGRPLAAGEYVVRVHAHDRWNRQLRRLARASGKTTLVVKAKPAPAPAPADPVAAGPTAFPVAGPFTYGDGFGAARKGYSHQGQDMAAARGTPVVAPTSGTVTATDYQASAAGEYVVMAADNGYAYFYAHCIRGSTAVTAGQAVKAGGAICQVGSTGGSTGPHLHFEVWVGGWRVDAKSRPIDPLPLLKSWE